MEQANYEQHVCLELACSSVRLVVGFDSLTPGD
jgi:hypothetical protein